MFAKYLAVKYLSVAILFPRWNIFLQFNLHANILYLLVLRNNYHCFLLLLFVYTAINIKIKMHAPNRTSHLLVRYSYKIYLIVPSLLTIEVIHICICIFYIMCIIDIFYIIILWIWNCQYNYYWLKLNYLLYFIFIRLKKKLYHLVQ